MTETKHGSNVAELATTATWIPEDGEFEIHTPTEGAGKDYIGNAALHARLATVFAQLEVGGDRHGVHALLVPIRDESGKILPGVRIEDCGPKLGLNGVDNGRIWFDRVRIPRRNLLNRFADVTEDGRYESPIASPSKRFFTMLGTLVGGRVSVALGGLSATKNAMTIAIRYGERRRQFGPEGEGEVLLMDYRTHQLRLLPRLARTYALHFTLRDLAYRYATLADEDRREFEGLAAGLKAVATRHTTDTIQVCRECCGGAGYLAENRFAHLKSGTDVFSTFEGDNIVLLQLLAKGLLGGYQKQFHDMTLLDMMRWVAGRAAGSLAEKNPVTSRDTRADHLRSADFQRGVLAYREERLLGTVARRLKDRLDDGAGPFRALIEVQDHLVATARAHIETVIYDRFVEGIEGCGVEGAIQPLDLLRALHGLAVIERDRGWFLQQGVLEANKSRAVRAQIHLLCEEIRPHAVGLVDAFGIPDRLVRAPIATC